MSTKNKHLAFIKKEVNHRINNPLPRGGTQQMGTMTHEGYCVKCRNKKTVTTKEVGKTKNGISVAKGACPDCGTKVHRFLGKGK